MRDINNPDNQISNTLKSRAKYIIENNPITNIYRYFNPSNAVESSNNSSVSHTASRNNSGGEKCNSKKRKSLKKRRKKRRRRTNKYY